MVEVLIPWRPGCRYRERALRWVMRRYQRMEIPVNLGECSGETWCKARAVSAALRGCGAEVIVVADADVWTAGIDEAVNAVVAGVPWAIPHRLVHRLDEVATASVLAGRDWRQQPLAQRPYPGIPGGGIVVALRDVIASVPLDTRFSGWGQEDESWAMALETLVGAPWRGDADLVHLFHPPQERWTRRRGSAENWSLRSRYFAARNDPTAMRALLEESRVDLDAHEPALHDHP